MSVVKSKRGVSRMEFVDNANRLESFTIRHCGRFPKRYTFSLGMPIVKYARDVYDIVSVANQYPVRWHDYYGRIKKFEAAKVILNKMVRQLGMAEEFGIVKPNVMEKWMSLIDREIRLLNGIIKRDKQCITEHSSDPAFWKQNPRGLDL